MPKYVHEFTALHVSRLFESNRMGADLSEAVSLRVFSTKVNIRNEWPYILSDGQPIRCTNYSFKSDLQMKKVDFGR